MNAQVRTPRNAAPALPRPRMRRDDQEFLPSALSILERPPSPIASALSLTICALAACALAWAYFGHADIVAVAAGKIQPGGRVRTVQPLETGRVRAILAHNGDSVRQGDVLVELDSDDAAEDARSLRATWNAARAEVLRRDAALEAGARGELAPPVAWPADLPAAVVGREEVVLAADLANLAGQVRTLEAQRDQKLAEVARLTTVIQRQLELIATQQQRVDMRATLLKQDAGTRSGLIDALESLAYQRTVLAGQQGQLEEAYRGAEALAAEREKVIRAFLADNATRRAEAARQADETAPRLAKADVRTERMMLRSPVTGVVQGSSVTSLGQVLSVGQEAMRVVPREEGLEIEVYLQNRDIGFVQEGQEATLKIETFPFTRYGTLPATVVRVASDAVPEPDQRQADADPTRAAETRLASGAQRMQNLVFPVLLRTESAAIVADGRLVPLAPGMAVTAEIKTGTRRIIDYVLSPLTEVVAGAGHER